MKAIILAAIVAYVAADCGVPTIKPEVDSEVRGESAKPHCWPWQVALYANPYVLPCRQICGGALISKSWILTAASCIWPQGFDAPVKQGYTAKLGADNRGMRGCKVFKPELIQQQVREVAKYFLHPKYNAKTSNSYDVALLKITPISETAFVSSFCLPDATDSNPIANGTKVVATGWGTQFRDHNQLQQMIVPTIEQKQCQKAYSKTGKSVDETMMCAGKDNGKKGCTGDFGGPLVMQKDDKWILEGISSWDNNCLDEKYPGVYARIANSEIMEFIKTTTNLN